MSVRRGWVAGLVAVVLVGLTGCWGGTVPATDFETDQVVGTWKITIPGEMARLEFRDDGTLSAVDWPKNLFCQEPTAHNVDEIDWEQTLAFEGMWVDVSVETAHGLTIYFESPDCPISLPPGIWKLGDGSFALKMYLVDGVDPDFIREDEIVLFALMPATD